MYKCIPALVVLCLISRVANAAVTVTGQDNNAIPMVNNYNLTQKANGHWEVTLFGLYACTEFAPRTSFYEVKGSPTAL